jgi:hypothetical protein
MAPKVVTSNPRIVNSVGYMRYGFTYAPGF